MDKFEKSFNRIVDSGHQVSARVNKQGEAKKVEKNDAEKIDLKRVKKKKKAKVDVKKAPKRPDPHADRKKSLRKVPYLRPHARKLDNADLGKIEKVDGVTAQRATATEILNSDKHKADI